MLLSLGSNIIAVLSNRMCKYSILWFLSIKKEKEKRKKRNKDGIVGIKREEGRWGINVAKQKERKRGQAFRKQLRREV